LYLCNEFEKFGALAVLNKNMTLQRNSKVRELPPEGPQREKVRIEVLSPIVPTNLTETLDEDNNEDEEEEYDTQDNIHIPSGTT
jgi:hypothetical protein